ncbi:potassium channel family protein [Thalassotalea ponticola]|uniref:potassium channel family protein n=1 Tax=Thalassotalea ponticola TaxID=1523392 RepID=UPI0025B5E27E|nr:potassium channel family protein [Thalassotalea ponticola]MDN3651499.1 potassium channel family protein [Thalassotalea ponticola]
MKNPFVFLYIYFAITLLFAVFYALLDFIFKVPLSWYEALYFSVVTITTLGFGDISPNHWVGMLLVSLESLLGIFIIGVYLNSLAHRVASEEADIINEQAREREKKFRQPIELRVAKRLYEYHQTLFFSFSQILDLEEFIDSENHDFFKSGLRNFSIRYSKEKKCELSGYKLYAAANLGRVEEEFKLSDNAYLALKKSLNENGSGLSVELQSLAINYINLANSFHTQTLKSLLLAYRAIYKNATKDSMAGGLNFDVTFDHEKAQEMFSLIEKVTNSFPIIKFSEFLDQTGVYYRFDNPESFLNDVKEINKVNPTLNIYTILDGQVEYLT